MVVHGRGPRLRRVGGVPRPAGRVGAGPNPSRMTAVAFFGAFLVLLLVGVPIAAALGVASLAFLWTHPLGVQVMAANVYSNIAKFPLLAIPFFILAGYVLDRVGVSRRLVDLL
ncbi:MAG: hypothetical protein C4303_09220, partial [candidate division GAL15 bacterium]